MAPAVPNVNSPVR